MHNIGFILTTLMSLTFSSAAIDFAKDIQPIFEERCISCHGDKKDKGDLRLHTHKELQKSKVITPKSANESSLFELISLPADHDDIMPPKGDPLSKEQIAKIKTWINSGAEWPARVTLKDLSKKGSNKTTSESVMIATNDAFKALTPIINKYCIDCHNADKQKGDLRLDNMDQDLIYGVHTGRWHEVLDVLNLGEMPPKKSKQLSDSERQQLINGLTAELQKAKEKRQGEIKTTMRRLNNEQYNNTLRDLLGVDFNFAKDLPEDAFSPEGFKNNGETLGMSTLQMEYYMAIARKALDKAIPSEKPEVMKFKIDFGFNIHQEHKESLTMGPGGRLIPTNHYKITAPTPERNYDYTHIKLRDEFVYNEGYKGNSTVKGDKNFKGYHHAVYPELANFQGKIVPQGMMLKPRGDLNFGKAGGNGPSEHMKLVLRDFPREGSVTIRVTASKAPNSLISTYLGESPANKPLVTMTKLASQPLYLSKANLEKPQYIMIDQLSVKEAGIYQLDVHLESEIDGPLNIHIGNTLLEGVRLKKGAANLVVPIALVQLSEGETTIKITSKKRPEHCHICPDQIRHQKR